MAKSTHRDTSITGTLRKAVADSGESFKKISDKSGVARPGLMMFARGCRHLRGDSLDKLASYFGYELVKQPSKE
jgi:hypothetical protein